MSYPERWEFESLKDDLQDLRDYISILTEENDYIKLSIQNSWLPLDIFPFTRDSPLHFRGYRDVRATAVEWVVSIVYIDFYGKIKDQSGKIVDTPFTHWCQCPPIPKFGG